MPAEFGSVVDAVRMAGEVQHSTAERNADQPDAPPAYTASAALIASSRSICIESATVLR
jgi:hypothetical protein